MSDRETARRKFAAVAVAEERGEIADSMDVRRDLIARMTAGTITHEQALEELARLKRGAAKAGKTTRSRAWRAG